MTRARLITLAATCLVAAGAAAMLVSYARERNRHFEAVAQGYLRQATAETSASTTAGDARAWLERSGFAVALYGDSVASESIEQTPQGTKTWNIVGGYRLVAPASAFCAERWVYLEFVFKPTQEPFVPGAFIEVKAYDDVSPTPAMRSEFARRSRRSGVPAGGL